MADELPSPSRVVCSALPRTASQSLTFPSIVTVFSVSGFAASVRPYRIARAAATANEVTPPIRRRVLRDVALAMDDLRCTWSRRWLRLHPHPASSPRPLQPRGGTIAVTSHDHGSLDAVTRVMGAPGGRPRRPRS